MALMPSSSPPLVLVVEDDPPFCPIAIDALEEVGFEVFEAPSANNGFDLACLIRSTYPHVHVVVSSGAPPPGFSGEAPDARFAPKPYRMTDIVRIIRGMSA
jgi:hypothetical protein